MSPVKHLLVFADGRVEDAGTELLGNRFIKPEMVEGDLWYREFQVDWATSAERPDGRDPKVCSMVALERSFTLQKTRAQLAEADAESRAKTMERCLWGIRNYPGDST